MHYFSINGNKSDDKKVTDYGNVHNLTPMLFEHISSNMFGGSSVMPPYWSRAKPWCRHQAAKLLSWKLQGFSTLKALIAILLIII